MSTIHLCAILLLVCCLFLSYLSAIFCSRVVAIQESWGKRLNIIWVVGRSELGAGPESIDLPNVLIVDAPDTEYPPIEKTMLAWKAVAESDRFANIQWFIHVGECYLALLFFQKELMVTCTSLVSEQ